MNKSEFENKIKAEIDVLFVRSIYTCGWWLVEVVTKNKMDTKTALEKIFTAASSVSNTRILFWKVLVYSSFQERFSANGTLHTQESCYDENGMPTVTLSADDCYLDITEFDSEILQLGYNDIYIVHGIESKSEKGHSILPYREQAKYKWLEAEGGNYGFVKMERNDINNFMFLEVSVSF